MKLWGHSLEDVGCYFSLICYVLAANVFAPVFPWAFPPFLRGCSFPFSLLASHPTSVQSHKLLQFPLH